MFKITNNLLKWMNSIIQNRISKSIFIQSYSLHHYEIVNLDDSAQKILVENNFSSFFESELGCSFLNYPGKDIGAPKEFPLVMPGNHFVDDDLLKETESGILVRYDFIGLFSWVLTRFEEINGERDKHGRFSALSAHAYKYNYLDRPIVDEWITFLRQLCQHIWPNIVLSESEFSIHISHDVDTPSRYGYRGIKSFIRGVLFDVIRLGNYFSPLSSIRMRINNKKVLDDGDSCNTFDFLMKSSEVRGLKSHFYFLIDNVHRQFDAEYDVCYPSIQKLIVEMKQRGHHVGVHSSYASIDDSYLMARHTEKFKDVLSSNGLQQEVLGGRMHFLRWDHPNTLRACEYAGFDYDCSLGYPEFAGFRCGTCHAYEAFDLELDRSLNLILQPLIVMEATFLSASYLQLGCSDKSLAEFKRFKDICKKYNGTYAVLFHNTSVVTSEQQSFYERVLDC